MRKLFLALALLGTLSAKAQQGQPQIPDSVITVHFTPEQWQAHWIIINKSKAEYVMVVDYATWIKQNFKVEANPDKPKNP